MWCYCSLLNAKKIFAVVVAITILPCIRVHAQIKPVNLTCSVCERDPH